ncbi:hypothetical protein EG329_002088 [Mollisiaceae sp. DMI_Dod_QoI]|nr:hypothetical protein EG329_002088 [Helotiales sp. DMI_Dod_QoI]
MLLSTIAYLLLPAAVLAAPAPNADNSAQRLAIREGEDVGLAEPELTCKIVSSDGPVKCRKSASFSAPIVTSFSSGSSVDFNCYTTGPCYEGNCTWDHSSAHGCYVNGYYTSAVCSTKNLPHC